MDENTFTVNGEERALLELLRRQPGLNEAVREVLAVARDEDWDADKVEEKLIEAIRRLGRAAMGGWAADKAHRVEEEMERIEPPLHRHKKKR